MMHTYSCVLTRFRGSFNRAIDLTMEVFNTYGLTDYWIALSLRDPNNKEHYAGSDDAGKS